MEEPMPPLDDVSPRPVPPPMPQGSPVMPVLEDSRPTSLTLFGTLHIIFASFSLLFAVIGIGMVVLQLFGVDWLKSFYAEFGQMRGAGSGFAGNYDQLEELQRKFLPYHLIQNGVNLVVGILIMMGGIKLIKLRKNGIKWSNKVSMLKIAAIILSGIISLMVVRTSMQFGFDQRYKAAGGSPSAAVASRKVEGMMSLMMMVIQAGSVLIFLLYPASALYFLNQQKPKEWLERYGRD